MANFRYFDASGNRATNVYCTDRIDFAKKFPGFVPHKSAARSGHRFIGRVDGADVAIMRAIEFKANPSLHQCGAKCRHAKGGQCECSCGGKYHGAGN